MINLNHHVYKSGEKNIFKLPDCDVHSNGIYIIMFSISDDYFDVEKIKRFYGKSSFRLRK